MFILHFGVCILITCALAHFVAQCYSCYILLMEEQEYNLAVLCFDQELTELKSDQAENAVKNGKA